MPNKTIISIAADAGKGAGDAKKYWGKAKAAAKDRGQEDNHAYTLAIFKRMIAESAEEKGNKIYESMFNKFLDMQLTEDASRDKPDSAKIVSSGGTAMKRRDLAAPIKDWLSAGYFDGKKTILDFGAGRGDNVKFLRERLPEADIVGYDPNHENEYVSKSLSGLPNKFDLVISTFVLNVVPEETQNKLVGMMNKRSNKILISTRDDLMPLLKKLNLSKEEKIDLAIEGFLTGKDQMQRLVLDVDGFTEKGSKSGRYRSFVKGL